MCSAINFYRFKVAATVAKIVSAMIVQCVYYVQLLQRLLNVQPITTLEIAHIKIDDVSDTARANQFCCCCCDRRLQQLQLRSHSVFSV